MSAQLKKIPLPKGFDPTNEEHMVKLTMQLQEQAAGKHPELKNYSIYQIDEQHGWAFLAPTDYQPPAKPDDKYFNLEPAQAMNPKTTGKRYEEEYAGYFMVDLNPITRILTMSRLDEATLTARRIFAAALGVNPWQIRVSATPERGWKIRLDKNALTYTPSRHDRRLQEAVEQVGKVGWFFKGNPETNVIMVYRGVPPTFPKTIAMPKHVWEKPQLRDGYFAMRLPEKGRVTGDPLANDWKTSPGVLVSGASNGGKSVTINNLIYNFVGAGGQLVVCDDMDKSVDFRWVRPWVMQKGWGADGVESTAAVLKRVLGMCEKRAQLIRENGSENWWGLPDEVKQQNPLTLLVCDEISQWAVAPKIPTGLDKDNPDLVLAKYQAAIQTSAYMSLLKISQKARFAGICFMYAAQSATREAGVDPKVRINLTSKILQGEKVQDSIRKLVLNDAKHAPSVPLNVIQQGVGRGTGVAELAGQEACVFKSYYEEEAGKSYTQILHERLMKLRPVVEDTSMGALTWSEITGLIPAAVDRPGGAPSWLTVQESVDDAKPLASQGEVTDSTLDALAQLGEQARGANL